ncbi:MAPEG family protein [Sphingorhabdus sp. Alg239-R122]|uniref:MAPEG family protein n=1 Tax=Sphingorhabdus sp. Alg239-R122 TaxID=2305989 RepID=UPI0013DD28B4|nr:MAPEG family protein [Sphingorhabdus sp. Alg239-R122]
MLLPITAMTAAICGIMILITAIATVRQRFKGAVAFGEGDGNRPLIAAMRSHGNLTEHAPIALIMIGLLEMAGAHHTALAAIAAIFIIARILHIFGLHAVHSPGKPPLPRSLGVIGTWFTLVVLAAWLIYMVAVAG